MEAEAQTVVASRPRVGTMNSIEEIYRAATEKSAQMAKRAERVMPGGDTRTTTWYRPYPLTLERGEAFDAEEPTKRGDAGKAFAAAAVRHEAEYSVPIEHHNPMETHATTVIVRDDGSKQWAYKSKPLYKWMDDHKPGDVDGDGRNNVWHVASP